jgi:cell division protease FtsH
MNDLLTSFKARVHLLPRVTRALLASLVALAFLLAAALLALGSSPSGHEIPLSRLQGLIETRSVQSAKLFDEDRIVQGTATDVGAFHSAYPSEGTGELTRDLAEAGAVVTVETQAGKEVLRLVTSAVLPILLLANLFALLFTSRSTTSSGVGEVEQFGHIDREGAVGGATSFADVAGVEEAREELQEVVDYLRQPDRYAAVGAVPPKGVLLHGPPGCGKTLLAKAVAGEAGVPFFSVAGAEFVESLVGVGAARVRDLFAKVRAEAPAIVFIDELDAAARRRGAGGGGGAEERDQTLNQLLVEMDGFDASEGIVVVAATNRPDILDPALLRPGRFDRHVLIEPPDVTQREAILRLHAARRPVDPAVDFATLARQTPGFTGADLANVLNEAALLTIRAGRTTVDAHTLSEAVQRVISGPQRRGHLLTEEERRRVACHEAGHAVAAALLGRGDRLHRLSIVARGRGLGTTSFERDDHEAIRTATQLRASIATALAGRAAEEAEFGEASTGSQDDLEQATRIAREMAGRHGFAPEVGRVSLMAAANGHLGTLDEGFGASEAQWAAFDDAVRRLVDEGHRAAADLVRQGAEAHASLTQRLLEEEALEGEALAGALPPALADSAVASLLAGQRSQTPLVAP